MNKNNYIKKVLKQFNMEKCKPVEILFDNFKLMKFLDEEF